MVSEVETEFLRAFAKLRNATIGFIMSLSVHPHERTGLRQKDFHEICKYFSKICRETLNFIKI